MIKLTKLITGRPVSAIAIIVALIVFGILSASGMGQELILACLIICRAFFSLILPLSITFIFQILNLINYNQKYFLPFKFFFC